MYQQVENARAESMRQGGSSALQALFPVIRVAPALQTRMIMWVRNLPVGAQGGVELPHADRSTSHSFVLSYKALNSQIILIKKMQAKQKRIFFIAFCHLAVALLLGVSTYTSAAEIHHGEHHSVGLHFQKPGKIIVVDQVHEEDHDRQSSLPEDDLPFGEMESDKESKEKDGNEDDGCNHHCLLSASITFSNKVSTDYYAAAETGGVRIPLFVLFHCWKSFIA